jgi:hypothetical protein
VCKYVYTIYGFLPEVAMFLCFFLKLILTKLQSTVDFADVFACCSDLGVLLLNFGDFGLDFGFLILNIILQQLSCKISRHKHKVLFQL